MKNVVLCGHTGSKNRGCEAIVRSTVCILQNAEFGEVSALTDDKTYDEKLGADQVVTLQCYPKRSFAQRAFALFCKRVLRNGLVGGKQHYCSVLKKLAKDKTLLFNVGGDTYCYSTPYRSYALNALAKEYKISNVFWGCSVDERCLEDTQMQADLNNYSAIVTRETLTYEMLRRVVSDKDKVLLACDPAFHLPIHETILPKHFQSQNTLGINLSDLVISDVKDTNDIMYRNVCKLIDYVLMNSDMSVCLIPHVYSAEDRSIDLEVLDRVKSFYPNEKRVMVVDQELSCTELKYIISNCRFFIGARTHSTIAAYSTAVPTIALSYSIKSRGIAKDLFGTEEGYAIPWKQIDTEDVLKDTFIRILYNQEAELRERYERILPEYKESILNAAREIKRRLA